MLDTGVLGCLCRPNPTPDAETWIAGLVQRGRRVLVPEICDYELRRELIFADLRTSIRALDALPTSTCEFLPITTQAMRRACTLWASVRREGLPTAADAALDGDCILAAQSLELEESEGRAVIIATTNVAHLSRLANAARWNEGY